MQILLIMLVLLLIFIVVRIAFIKNNDTYQLLKDSLKIHPTTMNEGPPLSDCYVNSIIESSEKIISLIEKAEETNEQS